MRYLDTLRQLRPDQVRAQLWNRVRRVTERPERWNPGPAPACPSGPPPTNPATNDFCDEGSTNTSFNDNYMPNLF